MDLLKQILRKRTVGFWLTAGAAVLSVVEAILYKFAVTDARYYSDPSFFLALFAFLPFLALAAFKATERYAPAALAVMVFLAFLTFLRPQSGYIGDIVYGASPSAKYIATIVLLVVNMGLSVAGIFMKQSAAVVSTGGCAREEKSKI